MKVDNGSRSVFGGCLWLSLIFTVEGTVFSGVLMLCSVLWSYPSVFILWAENTATISENLLSEISSLLVAAGFTSLLMVLTVCTRRVFWHESTATVSLLERVPSVEALAGKATALDFSRWGNWVLFVGFTRMSVTETRGDEIICQKSAATISKSLQF